MRALDEGPMVRGVGRIPDRYRELIVCYLWRGGVFEMEITFIDSRPFDQE